MAKQKLTYKEVILIKYLLNSGHTSVSISKLIGKVGPKAISKIKLGQRWSEVPAPTPEYGNELYLRLQRLKTLELECQSQL
jgi:hypothetical protein